MRSGTTLPVFAPCAAACVVLSAWNTSHPPPLRQVTSRYLLTHHSPGIVLHGSSLTTAPEPTVSLPSRGESTPEAYFILFVAPILPHSAQHGHFTNIVEDVSMNYFDKSRKIHRKVNTNPDRGERPKSYNGNGKKPLWSYDSGHSRSR